MKVDYSKILRFVLIVILTLSFTGCGKKEEKAAASEKPSQEGTKETLQVKPGDEVLAAFFDAHMFSAKYGLASIVTPASEKTKGEHEVEFLITTPDVEKGQKLRTKNVILKFHRSKKEELKVGMVVIAIINNPADAAEAVLTETWRKGVISGLGEVKNNIVKLEYSHSLKESAYETEDVYLHNIYIIDAPDVKELGE